MKQENIECPWCGEISPLYLSKTDLTRGKKSGTCGYCKNVFEVIWDNYRVKSSFPLLQLHGDIRRELTRVEEILEAEGFIDPGILQNHKDGQIFGLVKDLDETWQMHVRGYKGGGLEAEIEVSRWHLEHLQDGPTIRRPACQELRGILDRYGIYYTTNSTLSYQNETLQTPATLTDWRPLATILGIVLIGFFMFRPR